MQLLEVHQTRIILQYPVHQFKLIHQENTQTIQSQSQISISEMQIITQSITSFYFLFQLLQLSYNGF